MSFLGGGDVAAMQARLESIELCDAPALGVVDSRP